MKKIINYLLITLCFMGLVQVQAVTAQSCTATLTEGTKSATSLAVTVAGLPTTTATYTIAKGTGTMGSLSAFTPSPTATLTSFTDNTVTAGGTFRYQITYGTCTSAAITIYTPSLAATGLTATAQSGGNVSLNWTAPVGATSYRIERAVGTTTTGTFTSINSNVTSNSYLDGTSLANTGYTYRVIALNNGVVGGSATATVTTIILPAPTVTVSKVSPIKLTINWTPVAGAAAHEVQRATAAAGPWTGIANGGAGMSSFTDNNSGSGLTFNTTYYYRVRTTFSNSETSTSLAANETTYPLQPARNLTATKQNCSAITLNWVDAIQYDGYGEENYGVYRAEGNSTAMATLVETLPLNSTSWTDGNLKPNTTYTYYIQAIYPASRFDAASASASAKTDEFIIATDNSSVAATKATITWTVCSSYHQGYEIYLDKAGVAQGKVAVIGKGTTSYTLTGLTPNTSYSVTVHPQVNGLGGRSNAATFTTLKYPIPADLTVTAVDNKTVKLKWRDTSTNADQEESFYVVRKEENSTIETPIAVNANIIELTDSDLKPNTKYCYFVQSRNAGGLSEPSNLACATTCASIITKINSAEAIKTSQIQLTWDVPAGNTNSNSTTVVEASNDGVGFVELARIGGGISTYLHDNLTAGQKVTYRIIAINAGGCRGTYTPEIATRTCPDITKNVVAKPLNSTSINISWASQPNITEYVIERSSNSVLYTKIGSVTGDKTSFDDTQGLLPLTKYWYRVYANNEGICSGATSALAIDAIAETCPAPPTNLVATSTSAKEIKVTYNDNAPAETGFELEISKDDKTWIKSGLTIAPNITTVLVTKFNNADLEAETKYFFRVRSLGCNSNFTNSTNVTTNPPVPTGVTAKGSKISQIDLAWTNTSKTATNIEIESNSIAEPTFTKIATVAASTSTYSNNVKLLPNTLYNYRLRYISPNGNSEWTTPISGTTLVITADEPSTSLENKVAVYPIPADNSLFIQSDITIDGKVVVKILENNGANALVKNFQGLKANKTEEINISNLKSGIYIMQMQTKKGKVAKKFLKL
jgi:hypothetical protein